MSYGGKDWAENKQALEEIKQVKDRLPEWREQQIREAHKRFLAEKHGSKTNAA